jgi:signal transduction histidine kinase
VNLLQNAVDAVDPGGAIDIAVRRHERGVEVILRDDGVGIPQEAEGRLFDLFYTTKDRGTGLGLSTVKKIVDAHGGEISIARRGAGDRPGTEVRLVLPAVDSQI